jgi:hypothetical protein
MTPQIFDKIEKMSYGELLKEIENIKELLYDEKDKVKREEFAYYTALLKELDNRQILGERLKF